MDGHDDNIFDVDDALDCILHEEAEKEINTFYGETGEEDNNSAGRSGCLGVILMLAIPAGIVKGLAYLL
jgi:hypothetical protein